MESNKLTKKKREKRFFWEKWNCIVTELIDAAPKRNAQLNRSLSFGGTEPGITKKTAIQQPEEMQTCKPYGFVIIQNGIEITLNACGFSYRSLIISALFDACIPFTFQHIFFSSSSISFAQAIDDPAVSFPPKWFKDQISCFED